jgi:mitochondrial import inner membrane translocase subunit TIM50
LESAKKSKPSGIGALSNMLGLTSSSVGFRPTLEGEQDHGEAFAQGKMIQDIARERGQRYYEMLEKDLRENGEKYLKEEQAFNEKQQKEAMDSMFGSFSSWFVPKSDTPKKE